MLLSCEAVEGEGKRLLAWSLISEPHLLEADMLGSDKNVLVWSLTRGQAPPTHCVCLDLQGPAIREISVRTGVNGDREWSQN